MTMNRQHLVQQYVERQRAYIPTYATEKVVDERRTPSKLPRSDREFGFDTPVLRPRAPVKPQLTAPSKRGPEFVDNGSLSGDPTKGKRDKPKNKRKKASTPVDTDNEHAARLADRRERKRKKRAIVNPSEDTEENVRTATAKKGKTNKSAALALMYGFSATNVTKGRLTLISAPSLGVFSKGKASTKKRVTTTKKSSSRNELFSESRFLNKSSERTDGPSKIDGDSDDISTCDQSMSQETRVTNPTKRDRGQGSETSVLNKPSRSTHTAAASEIWDIEMEGKLPSSVCDVLSEHTKASTPVVLDLRGAEWSASVRVAKEQHERRNKTGVPSFSASQSRPRIGSILICSSPPAGSDLGDGLDAPHAADISSVHPSHSASQVGRRGVDAQASNLQLVTSKYFIEPQPTFSPDFPANHEPAVGPISGIDTLDTEDQDVRDAEPVAHTVHRVASPRSPPISIPLDVTTFRNRYDVMPPMFATNDCPCEDCWRGANVSSELMGGSDLESAESQRDQFLIDDVIQDGCHPLASEYGGWDPFVSEHEEGVEDAELTPEPSWMAETEMEESVCWGEDEGADFLEGRALLRGAEGAGWGGLSGLDEVERDVASRLRFHWRPLRL